MEENKENKIRKGKIVPYEKVDLKKDRQIWVDEVAVSYYQDGDCTEKEGEQQKMIVSSRNNGMARFINIKTDENGWSTDSPDEIRQIIEDFCKRASIDDIE